jgi:hypothetical protein
MRVSVSSVYPGAAVPCNPASSLTGSRPLR